MKLITRDTDYAIQALCCMAKKEKKVIAAVELTACLKIPKAFLRKILQILGKTKIIKSLKGQSGGYYLAVPSKKISLYDLIIAFQGPIKFNDHKLRKNSCPHTKKCIIKKKLDRIEKIMISELKEITVESVIKG